MVKLSLNKAAKEAGIAKSTLLEALNTGRMSAEKNEKGHWEIDPSELFRVFSKTSSENSEKPSQTPLENHQNSIQSSALEVEVKMLREQIDAIAVERDREREQLVDQIEDLRARLDGAEAERTRLNALLTDQRGSNITSRKRTFWGRLFG